MGSLMWTRGPCAGIRPVKRRGDGRAGPPSQPAVRAGCRQLHMPTFSARAAADIAAPHRGPPPTSRPDTATPWPLAPGPGPDPGRGTKRVAALASDPSARLMGPLAPARAGTPATMQIFLPAQGRAGPRRARWEVWKTRCARRCTACASGEAVMVAKAEKSPTPPPSLPVCEPGRDAA